jgi:hypothetical protein
MCMYIVFLIIAEAFYYQNIQIQDDVKIRVILFLDMVLWKQVYTFSAGSLPAINYGFDVLLIDVDL